MQKKRKGGSEEAERGFTVLPWGTVIWVPVETDEEEWIGLGNDGVPDDQSVS